MSAFDPSRLIIAGRAGSTPPHRRAVAAAVAALSASTALVLAGCGSAGSARTPAVAQGNVGSLLGADR